MAFEDELIKIETDLGGTPALMTKLKGLFEDAATGINQFAIASSKLSDDGKRFEVTLTGISKAGDAVVKTFSTGKLGGTVQGLKEVTAASQDLATGFNVVLGIAKQFQQQINDLNTSIKTVSKAVADGALSQVKAAQDADAAEQDLANKRRTRNREIRVQVTNIAAQQLGPVQGGSARELSDFQSQLRNLSKAVADEKRFPGSSRQDVVTDAFAAAKTGLIQTKGPLGEIQIAAAAVVASYSRIGEAAKKAAKDGQDATDKLAAKQQKEADKLAAQQAKQTADAQQKAQRTSSARDIGDFLDLRKPKNLFPEEIAKAGELITGRLNSTITKVQEATLQGKVGINDFIAALETFDQTGVIAFGDLGLGARQLLLSVITLENRLGTLTQKFEATRAKAAALAAAGVAKGQSQEQLQQIRDLNAAAVGQALRSQFQAPAGSSATDVAKLEIQFKKFEEEARAGNLQVDAFLKSVATLGTGGVASFDNLNAATTRQLRTLILVTEQLNKQANAPKLDPLADRIAKSQAVAADLRQRFSNPLQAFGQSNNQLVSTEAIDNVIAKFALLAQKTNITQQEVKGLFDAIKTPGQLSASVNTFTEAQQKLLPAALSVQKVYADNIKVIGKAAVAQQNYDNAVAAGRPVLDSFIAQLIRTNGELKPEKFASAQAAVNKLLTQIGKGNLDINKLAAAAANLGGGGGGRGGKGITFLPPDEGGREQQALLQLANLFRETGKEGKKAGDGIFLSFKNAFRILEVQTLHTIFGQFINDLRASVDAARQFQIRISEIRTISQENQLSTQQWSRGLRELSDSFGIPILDVTKAAYDAISNQVTKGAKTFEFLRTVLQFSLVTTSTATDAQNLLSSAIQAFGEKNITATKAAESLFKLIDLGRVTAGEISNIFGRVAQLAGEAGLNIDELGAALSTLTIQGVKPNEAFTLLNNLLLKLIKPSTEMNELLLKLGFSSGQAAIKTLGLGGVFRLLNKELESGGLSRIAELETNIRAIRAAVALTSADPLEGFEKNLQQFKNQTEQFTNAIKIVGESAGRQLTVQLNEIKNIFTLDFGQDFVASILRLSEPFGGLANIVRTSITLLKDLLNAINALASPVVNLAGAFLNLFPGGTSEAFKVLIEATVAYYTVQRALIPLLTLAADQLKSLALAALVSTFATNANTTATGASTIASRLRTIALAAEALAVKALQVALDSGLTLGLTAVVFAYIDATTKSQAFVDSLKEQADAFRKFNDEASKQNADKQRQASIDAFGNRVDSAFKNANNLVAALIRQTVGLLDNLHKINTTGLKGLEESLRTSFKEFEKKLTPFEQVKNILAELDRSQKRVASVNSDQDFKIFERALSGLNSTQQSTAIINKVSELRQKIVNIFNEPVNAKLVSEESLNDVRKTFDEISKILDRYQNQLDGAIKTQEKLIADLKVKGQTKAFEDFLSDKDSGEQLRLTVQRVEQLRKQAFNLFNKGNLEEARRTFDEINKLLENINKGDREFSGKAKKAGFNFGNDPQIDNLQRQNETDRLQLEQRLLTQLQKQKQEAADREIQNLNDINNAEANIQNQRLARIQDTVKLNEKLKALEKEQNDLNQQANNFKSQFNDATQRQSDAQSDFNNKVKESLDETNKLRDSNINNRSVVSRAVPQQATRERQAIQDLKEFSDASKALKLEQNQQNIEAFKETLDKVAASLTNIAANKSGKQKEDAIDGVNGFYLHQLGLLEQILAAKQKQIQAEKDIAIAQQGFKNAEGKLGGLPIAPTLPGTEPIVQGLQNFNTKFNAQLNDLSKSVNNLNNILKGVQPGNVKGFALGGPVGTDNTLAWFNRNEFIVNAQSSQRFAPQLRAINMGFEPKFSGTSNQHSVNVGDIHVNVQGQTTPNLVAREVGEQIRREIRRGTFRGFN